MVSHVPPRQVGQDRKSTAPSVMPSSAARSIARRQVICLCPLSPLAHRGVGSRGAFLTRNSDGRGVRLSLASPPLGPTV